MTQQAVLAKFDSLNVWKKGDQRAPHKPLLVLYALARWQQGEPNISFETAAPVLTELLQEFGPDRKTYHPELPFFHLQSDGVWKMTMDGEPIPRKGAQNFTRGELLKHHSIGCFSDDVQAALKRNPELAVEIATTILEGHFPESYHPEILAAVGFDAESRSISKRRPRDPRFRDRILTAYEYRCAICGFDVRLGSQSIALEAAHIKWHQAGGPDMEMNGIALCALHHKVFDLGAFTINRELMIVVSERANGSTGLEENLLRFHGSDLRAPQRPEFVPRGEFTEWHGKEVFKGRPRWLQA
ncbi:hypothetical protein Mal52_59110 [Symmachiella dynata]|uniref:Uncharacterized protein n=1 Tax=Symmachiella dynata TaxID=2527995 RepID=A0A517ZY24_9PLAN|nr:HNH endonuclease [Symmachiella dynata]QDU47382.1 hypothetical protein Mal52_59110 [Symmachiella dynata]